MAAIGSLLMDKVLGHSSAEKAFRPWWDTLEDFLIYSLVLLGIIVVPTAIITGTPLDCNFCQEDHCQAQGKIYFNNLTDPGFNAWWVKKFCTMSGAVDPFMLYFPYFLLIIAMSLFFIERVFSKIFEAGDKLEKFYNLLLKENVLDAKVAPEGGACQLSYDGGREALEIRQSFKNSNNFFISYLVRTILEIIVASILLIYSVIEGIPILDHSNTIICDVHSYYFECSGQPAQFYIYILYFTIAITSFYIMCNIYNLMWLTLPCFGKLSRLMTTYKRNMRDLAGEGKTDKELMGDLYDIYYNNIDLRLLLELLTTSSGVAPAIAMMTLFDKGFREAMKPKIKQIVASRELGIAEVQFQEPKSGVRACLADLPGVHLMYVAEIIPPAATAVEAFESKYILDGPGGVENGSFSHLEEAKSDLETGKLRGHIQRACFEGLKKDVDYSMKISTVVNGRTISEVCEDILEEHEGLPEDTEEIVAEFASAAAALE
eukprot:GFUD01028186.1.p1 GENE.GFUD01028186.1~~GFUD01028186.1.p1  ORF type:complete len:488 (+),score=99.87 GFUD01028186.1:471-1934(+)